MMYHDSTCLKKIEMFFFKLPTNSASIRNKPSYTMSSSSSRNTNTATPFCKVCRDAGRPEKEYTSHYVKDQPGPQGKVVCPTLLNQACRICHNTGHTSSYCPQYRPRREERYIEREREREREPRREERYIEREREPRREEHNDRRHSYDRLREDTERRDREIRDRDDTYHREQDRRTKPWLQVALKPAPETQPPPRRRQPYAHPHGPRVRLNLETTALSASKHAEATATIATPIDVRKVDLKHASKWGDEDANEPFVSDPEQMFREFAQDCLMSNLTTSREHDFIASCDNDNQRF